MLGLGLPTLLERQDLQAALERTRRESAGEAGTALLEYLKDHPGSPWRASILANLAGLHRRHGLKALALVEAREAWDLCRNRQEANAGAVGDQALGELLDVYTRVGDLPHLKALVEEIGARTLRGPAAQKAVSARRMLWKMIHEPDTSFQCGPMGLSTLAPYRGRLDLEPRRPQEARSSEKGTSLAQNLEWASLWGLNLQAVKREPGAAVLVPALIHWKTGHFSALVEAEGGRYRVLDPTYGEDLWIDAKGLDEEATGYALVPVGKLPTGWRTVDNQEAAQVWGKGWVGLGPNDGPFPGDDLRPLAPASGRVSYGVYPAYSSLTLQDPVLGYQPPRGYPVIFRLIYHQRFAYQPQTFTHSNVGPNWTFNWVSYVEDEPGIPQAAVTLYTRGGGRETFTDCDPDTGAFKPQLRTRERLVRTGPARYECREPDGSLEVFAHPNGAAFPRRVFLTERVDPAGNRDTFEYDSLGRVKDVKDSLGQATVLTYGDSMAPFRVTAVTDPFGRSARLEYTPEGQLANVTDAVGLSYQYTYGPDPKSPDAPADFLRGMKTPYGAYSFSTEENGMVRWIEIHDPLGGRQRVEYHNEAPKVSFTDPLEQPPISNNQYLNLRNAYVWTRKGMAEHAGDFNQAEVLHYIHGATMSALSSLLECEKWPLETRVWYRYPDMPNNVSQGTGSKPSRMARTLAPGIFQIEQATYNEWGKPIRTVGANGRILNYTYSSDGLDLLKVTEGDGASSKVLATYAYDQHHQVLKAVDAQGHTIEVTYNDHEQPQTLTDSEGHRLSFTYDPKGDLIRVEDRTSRRAVDLAYDGLGRVSEAREKREGSAHFRYDLLDRPVSATYGDGTHASWSYDRYDLSESKDRQGRVCQVQWDALRRPIHIAGTGTRGWDLGWSLDGHLTSLRERGKHGITWERDLEDRPVTKKLPNGRTVRWTYDAAGRPELAGGKTQTLMAEPVGIRDFHVRDLVRFFAGQADGLDAPTWSGKGFPWERDAAAPGDGWSRTLAWIHRMRDPQSLMSPWVWNTMNAGGSSFSSVFRRALAIYPPAASSQSGSRVPAGR